MRCKFSFPQHIRPYYQGGTPGPLFKEPDWAVNTREFSEKNVKEVEQRIIELKPRIEVNISTVLSMVLEKSGAYLDPEFIPVRFKFAKSNPNCEET